MHDVRCDRGSQIIPWSITAPRDRAHACRSNGAAAFVVLSGRRVVAQEAHQRTHAVLLAGETKRRLNLSPSFYSYMSLLPYICKLC